MKGEKFLKLLFITFLTSSIFLFSGCQLLGGKDELSMNLELGKSEISPGEELQIRWSAENKGDKNYPKENYSLILGYRKAGEAGKYTQIKEIPKGLKARQKLSGSFKWKMTLLKPGNYKVVLQLGKILGLAKTRPIRTVEKTLTVKSTAKEAKPEAKLEIVKNYSYREEGGRGREHFWVRGLVKVKGENNVKRGLVKGTFYHKNGSVVYTRKKHFDLGFDAMECVLEPGQFAPFYFDVSPYFYKPTEDIQSYKLQVEAKPTKEEPNNISDEVALKSVGNFGTPVSTLNQKIKDNRVDVGKLPEKAGSFSISGEVKNIGRRNLSDVEITLWAYNSKDELIAAGGGPVNTEFLKPSQNETFEAGTYLLDLSKVDHYRIEPLACAQEELT